MVITKERDHCAAIKRTVRHPNAVRSLVTSALLRRKVKARVQSTARKASPALSWVKTMTFDTKAHKTTYCFAVYSKDSGLTRKSAER